MRAFVIDEMATQQCVNRIIFFLLFVFFSMLVRPLYAEKLRTYQRKGVVVLFEEPLRAMAEEVADIYPMVKKDLEEALGWGTEFQATLLLIKKSEAFQKISGSNLIVAFAVPRKNLIVIDYSKMKMHPFSIDVTMKHELCHLLLHHHVTNDNLPKWLDEGIAQWVSGGIAEVMMNPKESALNEAILTGKTMGMRGLVERFPQDRKSLFLAYEQSKSLVTYVFNQFGMDGLRGILKHLKDGDEWDMAILKGLSISFDELEKQWKHHLKKSMTWFTYLSRHLYEILFFLSALIVIYGFIRVLKKKRAYMEEEEDNDFIP